MRAQGGNDRRHRHETRRALFRRSWLRSARRCCARPRRGPRAPRVRESEVLHGVKEPRRRVGARAGVLREAREPHHLCAQRAVVRAHRGGFDGKAPVKEERRLEGMRRLREFADEVTLHYEQTKEEYYEQTKE